MILPGLLLGSVFLFSPNASADPATGTSVKCKDGKSVQALPSMKPDTGKLDDKDYQYACRKNGGYRPIAETIICKDDSSQNVYKDAADPKDKLTNKDREKACASHGGIKKDVNDLGEETEEEVVATSNVEGDDCGGVETVLIKCDAKNSGDIEDNGIWGLLIMVLNVMAAGVGILAVGGIVYGAIMYVTAEDKAAQIQKANGIITNVVIGLIAFALMWSGLNFIVPGGVFSETGGGGSSGGGGGGGTTTTPGGGGGGSGGGGGNGGGGGGSGNNKPATIEDINVRNMRDAAVSTGGNVLKKETLYRSMALGGVGPKDVQELAEVMKGGLIIDLRTASQSNAAPDKNFPGVKNINIPIDGILDTAPMVTDATRRAQLAKALKAAANASGPVLIHCAAGKDRTGWMVAMIMYASGATDAQVMKEYLKSNDEPIDGGVKAEWLNSGLQTMRAKHGTAKGYLKSIGLTDADIAKLKKKFGA